MYLPAYIAERERFFKRRELDTKIVTSAGATDQRAGIRRIQFDLTAPDKVIHSALGGVPR